MKPRIRVGKRSKIIYIDSNDCSQFAATVLSCWIDHLNESEMLKGTIPIISSLIDPKFAEAVTKLQITNKGDL